jgi:hypothetical protein
MCIRACAFEASKYRFGSTPSIFHIPRTLPLVTRVVASEFCPSRFNSDAACPFYCSTQDIRSSLILLGLSFFSSSWPPQWSNSTEVGPAISNSAARSLSWLSYSLRGVSDSHGRVHHRIPVSRTAESIGEEIN